MDRLGVFKAAMETRDKGMRADQPVDSSRRKLLGQIGKAAWVAPALTVLTLGNNAHADSIPEPPPPPNSDPRKNSDPRNRGRGD